MRGSGNGSVPIHLLQGGYGHCVVSFHLALGRQADDTFIGPQADRGNRAGFGTGRSKGKGRHSDDGRLDYHCGHPGASAIGMPFGQHLCAADDSDHGLVRRDGLFGRLYQSFQA